jgi:hypothetical protein
MKKRVMCLMLLLGVLGLSACATSPTPGPTASPQPAATPTSQAQSKPRPVRFAPYEPIPVDVEPAVAPYSFDLQSVTANPAMLVSLDPQARKMIEQNGFVVVPESADQIYTLYQRAAGRGEPVFVTTDALLHTFHILYDYTLRTAEIEHFVTDLQKLDRAMLKIARAQAATTTGAVHEAAQRNVAYLSVALSLLDPAFQPPAEVADTVAQELQLIDRHAGFAKSPIFGYQEDYSQYVPRGHYTRNETFQRYFRAMMWHGRIGFRLNTGNTDVDRRETRQAILLAQALKTGTVGSEPALEVWDRIYEPTTFFVGRADDLTVYDYAPLVEQVYGPDFRATELADTARLDSFIQKARALRPPRIVSGLVTDREQPQEVTKAFRFMGQRFVPDSYIFQQLVYNRVGKFEGTGQPFTLSESDAGPVRGLPRGLDILAVLGSPRALQILEQEGDTAYRNYPEQMSKLQREFASLPEEQWTENLYWNWLHTLRPLLVEKGDGYPSFMQSSAWTDKSLHTALGSWTELRHDTILYAKQSYTLRATSVMPEPKKPKGYVEPEPEVYARLAALARQMRVGLDQRGLLSDEFRKKIQRTEDLLIDLKTMSEKELRGEALSDDEYAELQDIGDTLEALTTFSTEVSGQITSETGKRMAIVADVHTDTNTNRVLEEAVGDALTIYVIAPVEGKPVLTVGGVFSYYEFPQPMDNRLTDEAWQVLQPKPERPAWTASFISP